MKYSLWIFLTIYAGLFSHTEYLQVLLESKETLNSIPKIIHQIWVGDKPIPENYKGFMKTWKKIHPEWEYKLWTDEAIETFDWIQKDIFLKAKNPAMKADIWRFEILYKYGGLYVDCDMECIRPFDPIHSRFNGYFGFDQPNRKVVANSVVALKPGMRLCQFIMQQMKAKMDQIEDVDKEVNASNLQGITGPRLVTRSIRKSKLLKRFRIHIFPHEYFQPVAVGRRGNPETEKEFFNIEHTCFAIHHNGCSWTGKEFFPQEKE